MNVSIITSTNREKNINMILDNFNRQKHINKELIIILNYHKPNLELWRKVIRSNKDISIYHMAEETLGNCLNYAVSQSKYEYIAKMDADDYYGGSYLINSLNSIEYSGAHIVGKSCIYIFFKDENILGIKNTDRENRFVDRVNGSTLMFKKEIFPEINFGNRNLGEDILFCNLAFKKGYKIFSSDRNQYLYIRNNKEFHTWKIDNSYLIKECKKLGNRYNLSDLLDRWENHKD